MVSSSASDTVKYIKIRPNKGGFRFYVLSTDCKSAQAGSRTRDYWLYFGLLIPYICKYIVLLYSKKDYMNKIAAVIANLRKGKNWSQTDLANKSGVSREMISKYERDI